MREIKFRAWDKNKKKMIEMEGLASDWGFCIFYQHEYDYSLEVMQYTGLKDSNGKEIYEGDLMMWVSQDTDDSIMQSLYEIVFKDGAFMAKHCGGRSPLHEDLRTFLVVGDYELLEVVGNIFEDKELLEV